MAPLFSKVDLNKLWHDVQNEETLICAKFGKDLFNIIKVIGRKKWPSFFDSQCSAKAKRNAAEMHDFSIQQEAKLTLVTSSVT